MSDMCKPFIARWIISELEMFKTILNQQSAWVSRGKSGTPGCLSPAGLHFPWRDGGGVQCLVVESRRVGFVQLGSAGRKRIDTFSWVHLESFGMAKVVFERSILARTIFAEVACGPWHLYWCSLWLFEWRVVVKVYISCHVWFTILNPKRITGMLYVCMYIYILNYRIILTYRHFLFL